MKAKYAIVIVGYNRINSMLRTIESVRNAEYKEDRVDLIISLDNSGNTDIVKAANEVTWSHGDVRVRLMENRQGLKKHIMSCGDFLKDYEAIAVLEDDIIVSPGFYCYMKEAVSFYQNDKNIAGISLYGFEWNPIGNAPFAPQKRNKDSYFINFAQSWGQIWMRDSFEEFRSWFKDNETVFDREYDGLIPRAVHEWSDKSWLKYHIRYCAEKHKYFVYPYDAYSTNAGEIGEHYEDTMTRYQVSLMQDIKEQFEFETFEEKALKYDSFFENENIKKEIEGLPENTDAESLVIDLYGLKEKYDGFGYLLSTAVLDYEIVKSYGLSMRPHENNIIYGIPGNDIFLYDLSKRVTNSKKKKDQIYALWNYYSHEKFVLLNEAMPVAGRKFKNLLKSFRKGK